MLSFCFLSVIGFVASTIPELKMLTELACQYKCAPFNDILYGIPICKSKLDAIKRLKNEFIGKVCDGDVHLLVDNLDQIKFLEDFINNTQSSSAVHPKWPVFVKVDTGYHRAGVTCDIQGVSLAARIINSSFICLKGLYSHW